MGESPARCKPSAARPRAYHGRSPSLNVPSVHRNPDKLRYFMLRPLPRPGPALSDVNSGSQLVAVVTEVPGTEGPDARACFVKGNDLRKGLASGAFVCWRWRAGAGDHVA